MEITEAVFIAATGRSPVQDDLERCNCTAVSSIEHTYCGWCSTHNKPNFECIECMEARGAEKL